MSKEFEFGTAYLLYLFPFTAYQMNRPYGAVDVSANLKGAIPKTATQKILAALAEKGELVQKVYGQFQAVAWCQVACVFHTNIMTFSSGKTSFFVANQANIESISAEQLAALEAEHKVIDEENKFLAAEFKTLNAGKDLQKGMEFGLDVKLGNLYLRASQAESQSYRCRTGRSDHGGH
jgi:26S proteasome regulatory subunit (ATPase 3-interacting protein)